MQEKFDERGKDKRGRIICSSALSHERHGGFGHAEGQWHNHVKNSRFTFKIGYSFKNCS
jgi:hypothetical protein